MHVGTNACKDYFEYEDCGEQCIEAKLPCIISMNNENMFKIRCEHSNEQCVKEASFYTVCIEQDSSTAGGSAIWERFREKYCPKKLNNDCYIWKIVNAIIITINVITILVTTICMYYKKQTRRNIVRAEDNPYHSTTENINESEQDDERLINQNMN